MVPITQINHMPTLQGTLYLLWVVGGLFTKSCPTLCDPMDCSPSGSTVHGIFQAIMLEWVAISFSRGSSWPRNRTHNSCVSCTAGGFCTHWAIQEAHSLIFIIENNCANHTGVAQHPFSMTVFCKSHQFKAEGRLWNCIRNQTPLQFTLVMRMWEGILV